MKIKIPRKLKAALFLKKMKTNVSMSQMVVNALEELISEEIKQVLGEEVRNGADAPTPKPVSFDIIPAAKAKGKGRHYPHKMLLVSDGTYFPACQAIEKVVLIDDVREETAQCPKCFPNESQAFKASNDSGALEGP